MMMSALLLCCCVLAALCCAADAGGPVVHLKQGSVRGRMMPVIGSDQGVQEYLGVPFARPPLGPLRLAAPEPPLAWEGERDATQHPRMCLQDPAIVSSMSEIMAMQFTSPGMSEDCLYLNVYTPATPASAERLPVMVWIHGGGLYMGGASQYDGSVLAAYERIVVVVIQYRLGFMGYFSTGDQHARGNWGFLDQLAALRWVQDNIEHLGGDPQSVTIAGESAGGISASMLTLSPMAKGLFHRAIFQSGVATLGSYSTNQPLVFAKMVANVTDCDASDTQRLVTCLRSRTEDEIVNATRKQKIFMGATVDGVFLTDMTEELLKTKNFMKVPVMLGVTNHEFGWILPMAIAPRGWEKGMDRSTVLAVMAQFFPAGVSAANGLILDEYLKDAQTPEDVRDAFTDILGDMFMVLPVIKAAGYHRDAGVAVYMYEFEHRREMFKDMRPAFVKADHAEDVGFMMGGCFWSGHIKITGVISEDEKKLCKTMMQYWGNFVRTGSPDGPGLVPWPRFEQDGQYLQLGLQQTVATGLKRDRQRFFSQELPKRLAAL